MGSRMAANLISAGHQLVVYDSSIGAMERLCEAHDAEMASSPEDVASTEGGRCTLSFAPGLCKTLHLIAVQKMLLPCIERCVEHVMRSWRCTVCYLS